MNESLSASDIGTKIQSLFSKKAGLFARFFGCRHGRMSRPVTVGRMTYIYCAYCGIRRRYNPETFKPEGNYYYPRTGSDPYHI